MTQVMAKLKVVLQADDTVVAEADDPVLWQDVLKVINGGGKTNGASLTLSDTGHEVKDDHRASARDEAASPINDAVGKLAQQLELDRAVVEGALSPSTETPYLHLDMHCWAEMKRQVPDRGPLAINAISLASTLLALWFRHAGLGNPTQAQAQAVLGTVNLRDKNVQRGLKASRWLQMRPGGTTIINPAEFPEAVRIAHCFCSQDWSARAQA